MAQAKIVPAVRAEQPYLHRLRILAAFAVVVIHVGSKDFTVPALASADWQFLDLFECLSHWAVPVFVMISGALFLDPERELPPKKLFGKYIPRILLALIFWSALYAVAYAGIYLHGGPREIWDYFLIGHVHLWYLPMLIGLYLTAPLLWPGPSERAHLAHRAADRGAGLHAVGGSLIPAGPHPPGAKDHPMTL